MNIRTSKTLAASCCALLAAFALFGAQAADLVAIPRATSLLIDQVGVLTDAERNEIVARLKRIQDEGRAQIGVFISSGSGDEEMAPYALRVAEAWQLGSKDDDNGLLILYVPSKRSVRIEIGYGLEGAIPDARASGFARDYLRRTRPDGPAADQPGNEAAALNALLNNIVDVLPPKSNIPRGLTKFVNQHSEWKMPIVMLILSLFTLLPLLVSAVFGSLGGDATRAFPPAKVCIAACISAALFAGALGFAATTFCNSTDTGHKVAAVAFTLPLLWSLNVCAFNRLGILARIGYCIGNLGLFTYIFSVLTITGTAALYVENVKEIWVAPLFGTLFACGILAFVLDDRFKKWLFMFTAYLMYFAVSLGIAYVALQGILKDPTATAVTVAAVFTLLTAIGITLDDYEMKTRGSKRKGKKRWAWMFSVAALLFIFPFALVALAHTLLGNDFSTHFSMFMAGDGSFSQFIWWASGALGGSALLIGLGGKFGGGGAGG